MLERSADSMAPSREEGSEEMPRTELRSPCSIVDSESDSL
jgi:hypothetical protein